MNTSELTYEEELEIECLANCGARFFVVAPEFDENEFVQIKLEYTYFSSIKAVYEDKLAEGKSQSSCARIIEQCARETTTLDTKLNSMMAARKAAGITKIRVELLNETNKARYEYVRSSLGDKTSDYLVDENRRI